MKNLGKGRSRRLGLIAPGYKWRPDPIDALVIARINDRVVITNE